MTHNQQDARMTLLCSSDIKKLAPVSDMSLWRWMKSGEFPQPIKIARRNYWRSDEIAAWLARKSTDRAVGVGGIPHHAADDAAFHGGR